ncbi:hypothetical protein ACLOJK_021016 [Asimina triloba]
MSPPCSSVVFSLPLLLLLLPQLHSILSADPLSRLCSPFNSSPPYPFSTTPGYGHPSFLIRCLSNRSIITVRNISFSVHQFHTNLLTLSPFPSYPCQTQPINLSSSPFRVSNSTCSRLACTEYSNFTALKPQNCTITGQVLQFLHKPLPFFPDCLRRTRHHCDSKTSTVSLLQSGIELEWDPRRDGYYYDCNVCRTKQKGKCGYNASDPSKPFICLQGRRSGGREQIALFSSLFAVACLLLVSAVTVTIVRCRCWGSKPAGEREEDPTAIFLHRHCSSHLLPPVFTYEELESSTNRFDSKRKIGDGGFGSVYLAQLTDGQIVAVKRLHRRHASAAAATSRSFCNEVLILSSISHPNLVRLHGYCSDPRGLCLVYDYVPNGTLADHLHGARSLSRKSSLT